MDHSTNQIIGKVFQNQAVGETVEISGVSRKNPLPSSSSLLAELSLNF